MSRIVGFRKGVVVFPHSYLSSLYYLEAIFVNVKIHSWLHAAAMALAI